MKFTRSFFSETDDTGGLSLNAATTGTGTAINFYDCRQVNWWVEGAGTISGGALVIESARRSTYSGTWHEIDAITASDLTGGKGYGGTFPFVPGGYLRARITSNITGGGTVTVYLNGLQN